jgi:hypothetical protein
MRDIKQLLQIMLDNKHLFESGLCDWTTCLWGNKLITDDESDLLYKLIKENKPKFELSISSLFLTKGGYYWRKGCIYPRIVWIKKHLK